MKTLDVAALHAGIDDILRVIHEHQTGMQQIEMAIQGIVSLEDALQGQGGEAIRSFYRDCHLPFIKCLLRFLDEYEDVLSQIKRALENFEPDPNGYISESFIEDEVIKSLDKLARNTGDLTNEANRIMSRVSDIISLPRIDDTPVQHSIQRGKEMASGTVDVLHAFDREFTQKLQPLHDSLRVMNTCVERISTLFQSGDLSIQNYRPQQLKSVDAYKELRKKVDAKWTFKDMDTLSPTFGMNRWVMMTQWLNGWTHIPTFFAWQLLLKGELPPPRTPDEHSVDTIPTFETVYDILQYLDSYGEAAHIENMEHVIKEFLAHKYTTMMTSMRQDSYQIQRADLYQWYQSQGTESGHLVDDINTDSQVLMEEIFKNAFLAQEKNFKYTLTNERNLVNLIDLQTFAIELGYHPETFKPIDAIEQKQLEAIYAQNVHGPLMWHFEENVKPYLDPPFGPALLHLVGEMTYYDAYRVIRGIDPVTKEELTGPEMVEATAWLSLSIFPAARAGAVTRGSKGKGSKGKGAKESEFGADPNQQVPKDIGNGYNYWNKTTQFKNVKVYQRDDIINPNLKDSRGRTNLERMKKGLAPLGPDGKSINLHHTTQRNESSIAEVTQTFHKNNSSVIHINPNTIPSGINRSEFNKWRSDYWKNRANDF